MLVLWLQRKSSLELVYFHELSVYGRLVFLQFTFLSLLVCWAESFWAGYTVAISMQCLHHTPTTPVPGRLQVSSLKEFSLRFLPRVCSREAKIFPVTLYPSLISPFPAGQPGVLSILSLRTRRASVADQYSPPSGGGLVPGTSANNKMQETLKCLYKMA